MMRTPPPTERQPLGLKAIAEGLRFAKSRQELLGTYLVDIVAMFFAMPFALFPALAEAYGGGAVVGLLYAAPSAGAVVFLAASGWTARVHRHGRAVVFAACGWGVAIAAFGLAHELWLALFFLALAGGADAISGVFRATIWNETIPDRLRGRLAGLEMISWSAGPLLGNAEAGRRRRGARPAGLDRRRRRGLRGGHSGARRRAAAPLAVRLAAGSCATP